MAKLAETSEAVIMVSFIVMNLERILSSVVLFLLGLLRFWQKELVSQWEGFYKWKRMPPHTGSRIIGGLVTG